MSEPTIEELFGFGSFQDADYWQINKSGLASRLAEIAQSRGIDIAFIPKDANTTEEILVAMQICMEAILTPEYRAEEPSVRQIVVTSNAISLDTIFTDTGSIQYQNYSFTHNYFIPANLPPLDPRRFIP